MPNPVKTHLKAEFGAPEKMPSVLLTASVGAWGISQDVSQVDWDRFGFNFCNVFYQFCVLPM